MPMPARPPSLRRPAAAPPRPGPRHRAGPGLFLLLSVLAAHTGPAARGASFDWVAFPDHRRLAVELGAPGGAGGREAGFAELPPGLTGVTFTNRLDDERSLTNQILLNGSGVAAGDVDGDGLTDVYLCGLDVPNALYRNLGGWRFADIAAASGVACADQASFGAALADVDGDGDLDLLVTGLARGVRLFLNDGRGRFRETTAESGLAGTGGACSLALGDVDGDRLPELYVVHYRNDTLRDQPGIAFTVGVTNGVRTLISVNGVPAGHPSLAGRYTLSPDGGVLENGEPDVLYRNLGGGRFEAVPWSAGRFLDEQGKPVPTPYDWGLSALFRDLNGDRLPDLIVCNDFHSPDRFWLNDGQGAFRALPRTAIRQTPLFSMGVDVADLDRDGFDDLFIADMLSREHERRQVQVMNAAATRQSRELGGDRPQFSRNMLFRNRGDGSYAEIAQMAGVDASDWTWCPVFADVDLDGYEDLLVSTGHWRDAQDADAAREIDQMNERRRAGSREQLRARRRFPRLETPNFAFRNRGDLTFEETGGAWGFHSRRITQGMALADLDNDGDADLIANCLNDGPLLLRNDATRPRLGVRLSGAGANTRGLGARIRVQAPGLPDQSQEMTGGGRYLSSDDPFRAFAAGTATNRLTVEVLWRNGSRSRITGIPANTICEIREPSGDPSDGETQPPPAPTIDPLFEERTRILGHQHVDQAFDDFARQPLLPHSLAYPGPAVAWFDFNGDGWEDLLVGAGKGGRVAVFRSDGQGGFIPQRAAVL